MNSLAYPCAPVPEAPEGHYSRLCPCKSGQWAPHDEHQLADLAGRMRRESPLKQRKRDAELRDHVMRSGYVYVGQFIDHDITRDVRLLDEAGCDAEHTLNYRTPRLDLDLLNAESVVLIHQFVQRPLAGAPEQIQAEHGSKNNAKRNRRQPSAHGAHLAGA